MAYADPDDHSFNNTRRFTDRRSSPFRTRDTNMPPVRNPLPRVKPITNELEDKFMSVLKEIMTLESELEEVKSRLVQCQDFNLQDAF